MPRLGRRGLTPARPPHQPRAQRCNAQVRALDAWKLYLVDWGYNTPEERAAAAAHPRITVLDVAAFRRLLRVGG